MASFDRLRRHRFLAAVAAAATAASIAAVTPTVVSAREGPTAVSTGTPALALRGHRWDRQTTLADIGLSLGSRAPRQRPPIDRSGAFVYRNGRYTPLTAVPGATFGSLHLDVNARGETAGISIEAVPGGDGVSQPAASHGFVQDRQGNATTVDVPGAVATTVWGNNDRGQTVGFSVDPSAALGAGGEYSTDDAHVFVRDRNGRITRVDLALPNLRSLGDINDRGQIVGTYVDGTGTFRGFRRETDGRITPIDVPGGAGTLAFGIDNDGRVVGYYGDAGTTPNPDGSFPPHKIHAFRWDKGHVTSLDVPGSLATYAMRINSRGQIVGGYYDATGTQHGFVLDRRRYRTLTPPGRTESTALGIDDHGDIVVPEPTTQLFTVATR